MKEKLPHSRKPSHRRVCGEVWNLRKQHNWEKKKPIVYTPMFIQLWEKIHDLLKMLCFQTGSWRCLWQCTGLYQDLLLLKILFQVCKKILRYHTGTSTCRWFVVSFVFLFVCFLWKQIPFIKFFIKFLSYVKIKTISVREFLSLKSLV